MNIEHKVEKYESKLNSTKSKKKKKVYNKKLNHYSKLLGGFNFSNQIFFLILEDTRFTEWIRKKTKKYFETTSHEFGGHITIDNYSYDLVEYGTYDYDSGMIMYSKEHLENIKENQILWHTHNVKRTTIESNCEPPSGFDYAILMHISTINNNNPYVFNIAVHTKGLWIYKLIEPLNNEQIKDFDNFIEHIIWIGNAIGDIYCNNDPNTINTYHEDDLDKYGIKPIKSLKDYIKTVKHVFKNTIDVRFIPFEIDTD